LTPEEFEEWGKTARGMGFVEVASGPLVRSSYRAEEMFEPGEILCRPVSEQGVEGVE